MTLDTVEVFGTTPADLRLTRTTTVTSYNGTPSTLGIQITARF